MDDVKPQPDNQSGGTQIPVTTGSGSVLTPSEPVAPDTAVTPPIVDSTPPAAPVVSLPTDSAPELPAETPVAEPEVAPVAVESTTLPVDSNAVAEPPKDDVMPGLENESDTPPNDAPLPHEPSPMEAASVAPSASTAIKKKGKSMGAIIAVVAVVVVILGAVGYFAFTKSDDAAKDSTTSETTQPTDEGDSETPDSASTAIDDSLKTLDDSKDFNSSDIDDTALGL